MTLDPTQAKADIDALVAQAAVDQQAAVDAATAPLEDEIAQLQTGGATTSSLGVDLASYPGASWDDKLAATCSHVASSSGTTRAPILFPAGQQIPLSQTITVFDGMKLLLPGAVGSLQRAANSVPCDVRWSGSGPMLQLNKSTVFDVQVSGLSLQATNGGTFFDTGGGVVWTSVFRDLGFSGWTHGFGTPTSKFLNTACLFDGWWNVNNCRGTFGTFGGSDTQFAWGRILMDVGGNSQYRSEFAAAGAWLLDFAWQQKGDIDGLYLTCDGQVNGVRFRGSPSDGRMVLRSPIIEGRNAGSPCTGVNLQIDGGTVIVDSPWISYGNRPTSDRQGALVVVTGGDVHIRDPHYAPATADGGARPWAVKLGGSLVVDSPHGPIKTA